MPLLQLDGQLGPTWSVAREEVVRSHITPASSPTIQAPQRTSTYRYPHQSAQVPRHSASFASKQAPGHGFTAAYNQKQNWHLELVLHLVSRSSLQRAPVLPADVVAMPSTGCTRKLRAPTLKPKQSQGRHKAQASNKLLHPPAATLPIAAAMAVYFTVPAQVRGRGVMPEPVPE